MYHTPNRVMECIGDNMRSSMRYVHNIIRVEADGKATIMTMKFENGRLRLVPK